MKLSYKIYGLFFSILLASSLMIKFYFIPEMDRFLELTIKEQMEHEVHSFEKMVTIIAKAANKNHEFIREAFLAISADKETHVEFHRSDLIKNQFGKKNEVLLSEIEKTVMDTGVPTFQKSGEFYEFVYPLKANKICQGCHVISANRPVEMNSVLGLAVKRVPLNMVEKSGFRYFVMDLFLKNMILLGAGLFAFSIFVFFWMVNPIRKMTERIADVTEKESDEMEIAEGTRNEIRLLEHGIRHLMQDREEYLDSKKDRK